MMLATMLRRKELERNVYVDTLPQPHQQLARGRGDNCGIHRGIPSAAIELLNATTQRHNPVSTRVANILLRH